MAETLYLLDGTREVVLTEKDVFIERLIREKLSIGSRPPQTIACVIGLERYLAHTLLLSMAISGELASAPF